MRKQRKYEGENLSLYVGHLSHFHIVWRLLQKYCCIFRCVSTHFITNYWRWELMLGEKPSLQLTKQHVALCESQSRKRASKKFVQFFISDNGLSAVCQNWSFSIHLDTYCNNKNLYSRKTLLRMLTRGINCSCVRASEKEKKYFFRGLNFFLRSQFFYSLQGLDLRLEPRSWMSESCSRRCELRLMLLRFGVDVVEWAQSGESRRESGIEHYTKTQKKHTFCERENSTSAVRKATISRFIPLCSSIFPQMFSCPRHIVSGHGYGVGALPREIEREKTAMRATQHWSSTLISHNANQHIEAFAQRASNKPNRFERTCSVFFEQWNWERLIRVVRVYFSIEYYNFLFFPFFKLRKSRIRKVER